MKRGTLAWIIGTGVLAATVIVALWATGTLRFGGTPPPAPEDGPAAEDTLTPEEASADFLDEWVDDDGRVVRRDQGGDTVSEGQAYGLLLALGAGDEARLDAIWGWTESNLVRSDGLLAWRWQDGRIVDDEPAADADVDAARALVLAGARFDRPDLTEAGNRLADAVMESMTAQTPLGRVLLPGTWAAGGPDHHYNPSYASPVSFVVLAESTGDARWTELATGGTAVTEALLRTSPLPPDWAQITATGEVNAMAGAAGGGEDVRYSYDAARVALRFAESCLEADRRLAAQLLEPLDREDRLPAALDLGGTALNPDEHPLAYLARAAAAASADDQAQASEDIERAGRVAQQYGTYYGAAWNALGRLMLETDTLGGCPPHRG
ncbi:glycosyl hydrolase family 8 [Arthrobacter sp. TMS1-12-1]